MAVSPRVMLAVRVFLLFLLSTLAHAHDVQLAAHTSAIADICTSLRRRCVQPPTVIGCEDVCVTHTVDTVLVLRPGQSSPCAAGAPGSSCALCRHADGWRQLSFHGQCGAASLSYFLSQTTPEFVERLRGLPGKECEDRRDGNVFSQALVSEVGRIFCVSESVPIPLIRTEQSASDSPAVSVRRPHGSRPVKMCERTLRHCLKGARARRRLSRVRGCCRGLCRCLKKRTQTCLPVCIRKMFPPRE